MVNMREATARAVFVSILILITAVFAYTVVGGVIFHYMERDREAEDRERSREAIDDFLAISCTSREQLNDFLADILPLYDQGVYPLNGDTGVDNWTLRGAIFYAFTVITTIGYGHIAPVTTGGRAMTIFYAGLGIPLLFITIAVTGAAIARAIDASNHALAKTTRITRYHYVIRFVWALSTAFLGVAIFILFPALAFTLIENWTYFEAIYYAFITLTTIGFGDFVAAIETEDSALQFLYIGLLLIWILFGLAWLVVFVTSIVIFLSSSYTLLKSKCCAKTQQESAEEPNMAEVAVKEIPARPENDNSEPQSTEVTKVTELK